ncbi:hypothetical protein [Rhodococcus kronopolitis]|uniref:Uncharacterized protein n=1 Tax=Rhodococcus kronopolitis TaxID=1460226 RepID=A0ABV9FVA0_9NOCA
MTAEARLRVQVAEAQAALLKLGADSPAAATSLVRLIQVIAAEAARTPRFAKALGEVLAPAAEPVGPTSGAPASAATPVAVPTRRAPAAPRGKRAPGPFDPFEVHRGGGGSAGLRERLRPLEVDQLKDIIAEHAMDYDRLAMRWRTASKLQDRIVERVEAHASKGDAFR